MTAPTAGEQARAFAKRADELRHRIRQDAAELTVTEAALARLERRPRNGEELRALIAARRVLGARGPRA